MSVSSAVWNANGEALWPLAELLFERHYDDVQRRRILMYAVANRHLAGVVATGELDREDEAEAYQCLEDSFPPIGFDAADWDTFADADRWEPSPAIPPGTAIVPPDFGDDIPFLGDLLLREVP
jgi:hypothetical protein